LRTRWGSLKPRTINGDTLPDLDTVCGGCNDAVERGEDAELLRTTGADMAPISDKVEPTAEPEKEIDPWLRPRPLPRLN
jgi:hypothetical protein